MIWKFAMKIISKFEFIKYFKSQLIVGDLRINNNNKQDLPNFIARKSITHVITVFSYLIYKIITVYIQH